MRIFRSLLFATLAVAVVASAQEPAKKYGQVKVSGLMYAFYYYNLTNTVPTQHSFPQEGGELFGSGFNQFDIERVYVNVQSQLSEQTAFRFTTDVLRNSASGYGGLQLRVKYAYFDWKPASDFTLRFGQQGTPWFDLDEHAWGHRYVQQTPADKNGFLSSADLGFSAGWDFPDKYGSLTGYIFNGNGYGSGETNRFKDVSLKLEVNPFPADEALKGLKIAGFGYFGTTASTDTTASFSRNIVGGLLWYKYGVLNAEVEYEANTTGTKTPDSTNTASVFSVNATLHGPGDMKDWALFGRFDAFNPTNATIPSGATYNASNTKNTFIIAGISYDISKSVELALDYQGTSFSQPIVTQYNSTDKVSSDSRIFVHTLVNF